VKPFSGRRFVEAGKVKIEWWPRGRRRSRTIGPNTAANRRLADTILDEALKEARALAEGRSPASELTLGELVARHYKDAQTRRSRRTGKGLRPKTLRLYREYRQAILAGLDSATPATRLRRVDVRSWIQKLREAGWAEGTIARNVDHLKQIYRWATAEMEFLESDPIAGVAVPSRKGEGREYTPEEGRRLLEALLSDQSGRGWRFRLMALLEAAYGVRANQALHLRWDDVDLDRLYRVELRDQETVELQGVVTFRSAALGSKGQPDRELPLIPIVRRALLDAWNHRREGSPWVIWSWQDASKPSPYGSMSHALRHLEDKAGVAHVRGRAFHAFRRSLTTLVSEALTPTHAARWIGDSLETTMRKYVKPTREAEAQAAAFLAESMKEELA
jgi:integrase